MTPLGRRHFSTFRRAGGRAVSRRGAPRADTRGWPRSARDNAFYHRAASAILNGRNPLFVQLRELGRGTPSSRAESCTRKSLHVRYDSTRIKKGFGEHGAAGRLAELFEYSG